MREKGGSAVRSWRVKTHASRTRRAMRHPFAVRSKKRSSRRVETCSAISGENSAARARRMAPSLMSVPNTWIPALLPRASRNSSTAIASENASSPVEQPGTQMRMGASRPGRSSSAGRTFSSSAANTSGSRKKLVTWMNRSSWSVLSSSGSSRTRRRYSASSETRRSAIRRAIRRCTVLGL